MHKPNVGAALDSLAELELDGDCPIRVLAAAREATQRAIAGLLPLPEHRDLLIKYAGSRSTQNRYGK